LTTVNWILIHVDYCELDIDTCTLSSVGGISISYNRTFSFPAIDHR